MNNQVMVIENQPNKPTRVYNKIKDLEQYKGFILARFRAGERHKAILRALKNQMGVDFGESRLKRALEKWGASKANLTKSRKAHIQKVVKERYRVGKADARVKVTLRGRGKRLIEDNIDEILNMPDRTGLEPDPVGMELCTPTPGASTGREERNTPTEEQILAARPNDGPGSSQVRDSGDHPDTTIIDDDIKIPFGEARKTNEDGDEIGDEEEDEQEEEEEFMALDQPDEELTRPNPHSSGETDEQLKEIITRGLKALGTQDTGEIDMDDDLVESITSEFDSEYELWDDDSDYYSDDDSKEEMLDWDSPMLRWYARRYEHKYEAFICNWENTANDMIDRMQVYIMRGFSPKEASNMASRENEEQHGLHLPYEVCLNILQGNNIDDQQSGQQEEKEKEKVEDPDGEDLILCVERLFLYFVANSEDSFDDLIAVDHNAFTEHIIHLPRSILEYGPRSFLTAISIDSAFFVFASYDFEFFGDRLSPLADHSIKIFEEIGMGDNTYIWNSSYSMLDICSGRDRVLERLSRCYGESHPILVKQHIHDAELIARNKNPSDGDREALDKLVSKIGYNVHYCCQNFAASIGFIDIFGALWNLASVLCSSAATKLKSSLQNCLATFERPMGLRTCDDQTDYLSTAVAICMFSLGIACSRTGDFGTSLEILIKGHGIFVESHALEYCHSIVVILEDICQVADARGPVLYLSLQPAFVNTHKRLSKLTRSEYLRQRQRLRKLWNKYKAYKNRALQEEYSKIISHRPPSRASTPDLRSYHYYEALKDWMNSQGGGDDIMTDVNLGGQVMEMDDIEMGADMTAEMSVEQELQMITQRYIQAEAAGLVDASGRFPF
ncbi:hypothetical protein AOL_s00140g107 [Orbilia oligospora ATCC 24927]|uniref:Clr5 domain-containing protein n=1 Tax=Arthrobotrys oligospora (strain ATCC 24927 / CBS 115.81 / DSM 1491) TaxID=756982 RepID=G1XMD8_ARTOA|nr:hypothetical protein AOL_s00140g107 [Orbilia oligospora ATCC 24927]EGX45791.1 hypothetical protein AOL_s00140g107 [Orbilia oligospora ATCC 24927]